MLTNKRYPVVLVALLLAGCAVPARPATPTAVSAPSPPATPTPTPVLPTTAPASPIDTPTAPAPRLRPTPLPAVERAVADLAARLGAAPETIEVVSVTRQEVALQDVDCGSQGTPPSVDIPAMAMVDEIVLGWEGSTYVYYASGADLSYCGQR